MAGSKEDLEQIRCLKMKTDRGAVDAHFVSGLTTLALIIIQLGKVRQVRRLLVRFNAP